ncbi:hypothetical protein GOBAR_DD27397 [Gossypium barbadense]|nr:hypothetical protein GOBAR_DD27397 [Gossypium barbadense]
MHMRALGNQYKTPEALAKKPENGSEVKKSGRKTRFSCPYGGCNRSKKHDKFRPFKSVICVRNHFKRSHCPKRYGCNKCHKKKISVLADLKSHLKHCAGSSGGEESKKWKCSCGNSFCRKDKLFRRLSLFEGHMPAVAVEEEEDDGFHARSVLIIMNGVWISKSGKTMMIRNALLRIYLPKRMKRNRLGLWNKAPESSAPAPQPVVRKMMLVENARSEVPPKEVIFGEENETLVQVNQGDDQIHDHAAKDFDYCWEEEISEDILN